MSRAEELAKAYEESLDYYHCMNDWPSIAYREGYEQAEKDLILTWQDIKTIVEIADEMVSEDPNEHPDWLETEEGYYKAILEEFNKTRK